ncbi:response regulator transcription factor [Candidatus Burkholderia verschuerenii]|uniref:response regulator transcription factor n=1 Tax=Candidatus Burkholderia verschuerenii TaxID=242163 RepID=UPI00067C3A41|nr:response regulator transcription factor [Candidatus Burkholderia verschuerenii]
MKLLLVEDSGKLAHWIVSLLTSEGFFIDHVSDAEQALPISRSQCYDVILLDMRLPSMSGKEFLSLMRRRGNTVPVLMLTAHGSIDDKVSCFEAGADDYVVKPVDARELVARIKALVRRRNPEAATHLLCGDLEYRFDSRQFRHDGKVLALRRREHAILETLILRQGKTVSKSLLMESIFGLEEAASVDAVDLYVHRLRKHLVESRASIMTLRGLGYMLREREN